MQTWKWYEINKNEFPFVYTVEHGSYWDHVEQFHLLRAYYPNLLFITYENMKHDLEPTLKKLCNFLNKTLNIEQTLRLINHLQFARMKVNPAVNPVYLNEVVQKNRPGSEYSFVRRGVTESHKDEMPPEYIIKFDEVTKRRFEVFDLYQSDDQE